MEQHLYVSIPATDNYRTRYTVVASDLNEAKFRLLSHMMGYAIDEKVIEAACDDLMLIHSYVIESRNN